MELHMNPFKGRHFQRDIILWAVLVLQIRHQLP
jgi:transposase-like protein